MPNPQPSLPTARLWGLGVCLSLVLVGGCSDVATDIGIRSSAPPTIAPKVERLDPVTTSGRAAAVLSVHMRSAYPNACKYGMTLTNHLSVPIVALTYRLTAIIDGNVPFESQNKSFSEIRPSEHQYRDLTFQGVSCDRIARLEVMDPGRCNVGDLNRFNTQAGDCAKLTDLAPGRLVSLVWKRK